MTNKNVVNSLKAVLADSYILYLKTQNFHWNVTGPNFKSLHLMFEEQYSDLAVAIDLLAERIRALGEKAPGSFASYVQLSSVKEAGDNLTAELMLKQLVEDQKTIIKDLTDLLEKSSQVRDEVTLSMAADRIELHQKNLWMLQSSM